MFRFNRLREEDLETVLRWRTQPDVTRYMNTDIAYDLENQKKWFRAVKDDRSSAYWVIRFGARPIGMIYLTAFDAPNARSSYGYYLGEADARYLGGLVLPYFYNHVFHGPLALHKLSAEIFTENAGVCKLHRLYGYREIGVCKDHVLKNGRYHDVSLFELLKTDWEKSNKRFGHYTAAFE